MRVKSIDIFRAITMVLMIFVNDLWTLSNIPHWLEHSKADVDFLGLADIVFPCFLFVMGMSVPYAIQSRLAKGQRKIQIAKHILLRSVALIVMGLFTVNQPYINSGATGLPAPVFTLFMIAAFFLVWNTYLPKNTGQKIFFSLLQLLGVAMLIFLAVIFRGETSLNGQFERFGIHWWGILGLIGWTYLACAAIILWAGSNKMLIAIISFFVFMLLNIWGSSLHARWFIGNGAMHALTMAGIVTSLLFEKYKSYNKRYILCGYILSAAFLSLAAGFVLRNYFIISKIYATPTWVMFCISISLFLFLAIYWVSDVFQKHYWFTIIGPAGSNTLTCYLLPYIAYSVTDIAGLQLPQMLTTGATGLIKSFLFALFIVGSTWLANKIYIRVRV